MQNALLGGEILIIVYRRKVHDERIPSAALSASGSSGIISGCFEIKVSTPSVKFLTRICNKIRVSIENYISCDCQKGVANVRKYL